MKLELQATPHEVMRAVEALQEFGREIQIAEKDLFGLTLALEECGSNIVNHALGRDPRQKFQVEIELTSNVVAIELRDHGPEFDPTKASVVEFEPAADERPPGGWGIPLVRRYLDEICYCRERGENVLRLTKRLISVNGPK
jgi:anti-sigma regulatory factor (Ser/Thr protein kinase)